MKLSQHWKAICIEKTNGIPCSTRPLPNVHESCAPCFPNEQDECLTVKPHHVFTANKLLETRTCAKRVVSNGALGRHIGNAITLISTNQNAPYLQTPNLKYELKQHIPRSLKGNQNKICISISWEYLENQLIFLILSGITIPLLISF